MAVLGDVCDARTYVRTGSHRVVGPEKDHDELGRQRFHEGLVGVHGEVQVQHLEPVVDGSIVWMR